VYPAAQQIIEAVHSYTEYSPSGQGIRIILEGKLPGARRRRGRVELYEDLRYVTITGHHIAGTPHDIQPRHKELYGLYQRLFPQSYPKTEKENAGREGSDPKHYQLALSDDEVLQKALHAKNGENFKRYYTGDTSLWEGAETRHSSQSEADFTLVLLLLYWTNNDVTQVDRLFRQSGLMRPKWTRPLGAQETYGERVIADAQRKGNS
jgi:primase-polymerase (primpol)-like protein